MDRAACGRCTILLPTTGNRGPLLPLVIACVRRQDWTDWELLIVADGIDAPTRAIVSALVAEDSRIRCFDHPKHARRGEEYRHAALSVASGDWVAYLTDRDLWFDDHLSRLAALLADHDFAHTGMLAVLGADDLRLGVHCNLAVPRHRRMLVEARCPLAFSSVGHRLDTYRRLPAGWQTTPADVATDRYMWRQFLQQAWLRAGSGHQPTLLYFHRGTHPGWSTSLRAQELLVWSRSLADPFAQAACRARWLRQARRPLQRLRRAVRSWLFWRPAVDRWCNHSRWLRRLLWLLRGLR